MQHRLQDALFRANKLQERTPRRKRTGHEYVLPSGGCCSFRFCGCAISRRRSVRIFSMLYERSQFARVLKCRGSTCAKPRQQELSALSRSNSFKNSYCARKVMLLDQQKHSRSQIRNGKGHHVTPQSLARLSQGMQDFQFSQTSSSLVKRVNPSLASNVASQLFPSPPKGQREATTVLINRSLDKATNVETHKIAKQKDSDSSEPLSQGLVATRQQQICCFDAQTQAADARC